MAISSIHIENGKPGYFAHNSREAETKNSIFTDEKNYCSCSKDEAFKIYRTELRKRKETYINNTKQKFQAKTVTHLSAILNFNKEHTPADIKKVCDHLEKILDTKVIQYSMHRDEGHTIEKNSEDIHNKLYETIDIKNYHAHIEFMGINSKGKSLKQKIDKPFLKKLQTDVAKILNMKRGQESGYSKEEYKKIQEQLEPIASYPSKKAYNNAFNKVAKELGYIKERKKPAKRLDTYQYKEFASKLGEKDKEIEELKEKINSLTSFNTTNLNDFNINNSFNKKLFNNMIWNTTKHIKKTSKTSTNISLIEKTNQEQQAKIKDLKQEVKDLREELKNTGMTRDDFKEIEDKNKELHKLIKQKDLSLSTLKNEIQTLKDKLQNKEQLEIAQGWKLDGQPITKDEVIKQLYQENKELKAKLQEKDQEIEDLKSDLAVLQKQSNAYYGLNQDLKEEINSLKSIINDLESQRTFLAEKSIKLSTNNDLHSNMEHLESIPDISHLEESSNQNSSRKKLVKK